MSTQPSAAAKTERLLNLVICLLYTRRPLSKAKIRDAVPQYGLTASTEAFDRMFERDKDELRDLGIPLVTEPVDAYFDDEPGYRIDGARVRPAGDLVRAGRAGRPRPGQPGLGAGEPGRSRRTGPAQAAAPPASSATTPR